MSENPPCSIPPPKNGSPLLQEAAAVVVLWRVTGFDMAPGCMGRKVMNTWGNPIEDERFGRLMLCGSHLRLDFHPHAWMKVGNPPPSLATLSPPLARSTCPGHPHASHTLDPTPPPPPPSLFRILLRQGLTVVSAYICGARLLWHNTWVHVLSRAHQARPTSYLGQSIMTYEGEGC